jgi:hypothetical protein
MAKSSRTFVAAAVLLLSGSCAAPLDPQPAAVSHMSVDKKQDYIRDAESTLKVFNAAAMDLHTRGKPIAQQELAREVKRYIKGQVKPIIVDFEAGNNLETRLEIAKLQLLCGFVYLELEDPWEAVGVLREMERRYGDQPDLLRADLERNDLGFASIAEGMRDLEDRLPREPEVQPTRFLGPGS